MKIDVITLFEDFFTSPLATGLVGKAIASGAAEVRFVDPRTFTSDVHRTVDDAPYGGGAGMVMKVEPLVAAIREARSRGPGPVVMLSPQGRPATQADFARWAANDHLALIAGRYEGFDERVRAYVDEEISVGDFVLTGGEYGALTIVDGVVRLLPGTLGNADSSQHDSFAAGLLEHPQYTRPMVFEGAEVPEVLGSGHHARVEAWRHEQALRRTRARRPDLIAARGLTGAERRLVRGAPPDYVEDPFAPEGTGEAEGSGGGAMHDGAAAGGATRAKAMAVGATPSDAMAAGALAAGAKAVGALAVAFASERSDEALVALARLAAAYELKRLYWVGGDAERVAALAPIEIAVADERPRRARRGRPPKARLFPSRAIEVVPEWAAVTARGPVFGCSAEPPDGASSVAASVVCPRGTASRPRAERGAAEGAPGASDVTAILAFGAPPEAVTAWLPAVRAAGRLNRLPLLAAIAAQLERVRGEG